MSKWIRLATAGLVLASLCASLPGRAAVIFSDKASGTGDNVLWINNPPDGTTVQGIMNHNHSQYVDFTSSQVLHASGGQAKLTAADGSDLTNVLITPEGNMNITTLVASTFKPAGPLTITANANDGTYVFTLNSTNGEDWFTLNTTQSTVIDSVLINGGSWEDLRHVRLELSPGGYGGNGGGANTPEPGSVAMLASMSIGGLAALKRRFRRA